MMIPIIDFDVINIDQLSRLLVIDQSKWLHLEAEPVVLEVTIPGNKEPFKLNFTKGGNQINSYTLNLISNPCKGCTTTMIDGVYKITLKVCGETINSKSTFECTKYFLRTFHFQEKLDQVVMHKDVEKAPYKNYIVDILFYVQKAKSALKLSCLEDVMTYYAEADKLLNKIIKDLKIIL